MPWSMYNLNLCTDESVEDFSQTGSCTSVRSTDASTHKPENYMPRHPANGGGYK